MRIRPKPSKWRLIRRLLLALGVVVIGVGGFVAWKDNFGTQTPGAVANDTPATHVQANEGKDKTPLPKNTLADYKVAADAPRAIYINKLGVAARLLPMGVNADNSMQAPININDGGWYTGSAKPGKPGAMVVDGHASKTGTNYGLFGNLNKLNIGDKITVERGDGTKFTYQVAYTEEVPEDQVDMNKVMVPYGNAAQSINLITCAGEWTKDGKTLDHRIIVYATLVG
jgi:LPXTG-site transpeptidase (sortase) family protein